MNNRPTGPARQNTARVRELPAQFWAVLWKQTTLIGVFTTLNAAELWAADHGEECLVLNIYAPMVDEPNLGHEIGQVIP